MTKANSTYNKAKALYHNKWKEVRTLQSYAMHGEFTSFQSNRKIFSLGFDLI